MLLPIEFDENLPVNVKRAEIAEALLQHQVLIVCGETGSGKTTQLPKICLELGRGVNKLIGHTQPRRIAARATASRIAQELKTELGSVVGFKIRFTDRVSAQTKIKLMTDGILLAETQTDPQLFKYDTLILDEAHERSLNIDFLLGYLKRLLPKRPDLKLIVTSATLDAARFSRHFNEAPVIEVSGRLYPIDIRYRPVCSEAKKDRDLMDAIVDAVDEVWMQGSGDVLVFLPGEREIREAREALQKHHFNSPGSGNGIEILPLLARQSAQEQSRIFSRSKGRRVVLATNVAETSLTVPGIRYVIDTGLARVKRYSYRNKVEQLQVEPIAQSAAKQRAGRCGRVASGLCIRLYDEEDFAKRPHQTDPEILRSSLASVILRMTSLHLGEIEDFPFLDKPLSRMISDGYQLLAELGAVTEERALTKIGEDLARLPLDPRIARMILAARVEGCLSEMLIIAAALSSQDPRERPIEQAGSADQAHAKWKDERSEFLAYPKLWATCSDIWQLPSQRKQRDACQQHFLNYVRVREWRDVYHQLHTLATEHGWRENEQPATYEAIHRALLTGLLGNIGMKNEENIYLGARGIKFLPHPGSSLAKKAGKWIMAAELVETTRLFARCLAKIEPEWLEQVGAHLIRRHYYEPHWQKKVAHVAAFERATLYGLVLHARRLIAYKKFDPKLCREIFIREALVRREYETLAPFFQHNALLIADIEKLEHKARRPDVLVDEDLIYAFYDNIIPADVCDGVGFEYWRKRSEQENPTLLFLDRAQLMRHEAAGVTSDKFPAMLVFHGSEFTLSYHFELGSSDDGVTLTAPLAMLNQISVARCEWLVPGMLEDKVLQLLKTLPQKIRQKLAPLDAFVDVFADTQQNQDLSLIRALTGAIEDKLNAKLPLGSFRPENLPIHLLMNFRVMDEHGRVLAQSRNLSALKMQLNSQIEASFAQAENTLSQEDNGLSGLTDWSFGDLPELLEVKIDGQKRVGFSALVDEGDTVSLRAFDTPERAESTHRQGLRRLFALSLKDQIRFIEKSLSSLRELVLQFMPWGSDADLREQIISAALECACMMAPLPRSAAEFAARKEAARPRINLITQEIVRLCQPILAEYTSLQKKLPVIKAFPAASEDIQRQLAQLLPKRFIAIVPFGQLQHFLRYLKAISLRIDKLRVDPARDDRLLKELLQLLRPFEREQTERARAGRIDLEREEFRWLLEELRVALFAQELKTPMPVSVKRLQKMWEGKNGKGRAK